MTPLTWSMLQGWRRNWTPVGKLGPFGNLGGRLYLNVSYFASLLTAVGRGGDQILTALEDTLHMPLPEGITIPVASLSGSERLGLVVKLGRDQLRWASTARRLPAFVKTNPAWCSEQRQRIRQASDPGALAALWGAQLEARGVQAYLGVLSSAMRFTNYASVVRQELSQLAGPDDVDALTSNLSGEGELLASLGPLVGLAQAANGEITSAEYLDKYGHRGPNEWNYIPRPVKTSLAGRLAEFAARGWMWRRLAGQRQRCSAHQRLRSVIPQSGVARARDR
jgi:pyruvate,water dikinase